MEEAMSNLVKEYDDMKLSLDDYENNGLHQNKTTKTDEWNGKDTDEKE